MRLTARWTLGLLALALVAGCSGHHNRAGWHRYVDRLGWSIVYPRTMHLERSEANMRISVGEVTVASFAMRTAVKSGPTWLRVDPPRPHDGRFPAAGVALRIERSDGGPAPDVELPETRFPLQLSRFRPASEYPHTLPKPLGHPLVADGRNYFARAWIGPKAPAALRGQLARIVSSISFPRLRTGATVGYGFSVLGPAGSYPVGSFTRVRAQRQPFYLVHAPGGFYAIGWRWETITGGYKSRCAVRLDERRKEFFCANMHARWDRIGRVLALPERGIEGDPLNVAVAKLAWDGHVLLEPGTAGFADARDAHRLWPHWH